VPSKMLARRGFDTIASSAWPFLEQVPTKPLTNTAAISRTGSAVPRGITFFVQPTASAAPRSQPDCRDHEVEKPQRGSSAREGGGRLVLVLGVGESSTGRREVAAPSENGETPRARRAIRGPWSVQPRGPPRPSWVPRKVRRRPRNCNRHRYGPKRARHDNWPGPRPDPAWNEGHPPPKSAFRRRCLGGRVRVLTSTVQSRPRRGNGTALEDGRLVGPPREGRGGPAPSNRRVPDGAGPCWR